MESPGAGSALAPSPNASASRTVPGASALWFPFEPRGTLPGVRKAGQLVQAGHRLAPKRPVCSAGMDEVTVRPATLEDLPVFEDLWRAAQEVQGGFRPFAFRMDPIEYFRSRFLATIGEEDGTWLAAEAGGTVVGMARLELDTPSRVSDEQVLEMSRVSVAPEWRGRGVGRLLLAEAERIAREAGCRFVVARVFSGNRDALAFWDAVGFEPWVEILMKPVAP